MKFWTFYLPAISGEEIKLTCTFNSRDGHRKKDNMVYFGEGSEVYKMSLFFKNHKWQTGIRKSCSETSTLLTYSWLWMKNIKLNEMCKEKLTLTSWTKHNVKMP